VKIATAVRRLLWVALLTLAVAVGFLLLSLVPGLQRMSDEVAEESISADNLKAIGTAVSLYRNDHGRVPPPNLDALVAEGILSEEKLISHLTNRKTYVYIRLPDTASDQLIQAYEDPTTHGLRSTAVLFVDSHVQVIPVDDKFWDLVNKSKAQALPQESPTTRDAGLQTKAGE
jgi:type II secretory pathway pseudopilin PulG